MSKQIFILVTNYFKKNIYLTKEIKYYLFLKKILYKIVWLNELIKVKNIFTKVIQNKIKII